ncbi:MAG: DUF4926 domain-containing protein [Betaproteobacteria bacterium RIFCSPLOWO2_12_FULL_62_13b]|nr:MAG: DUF4926 domain-containing protein [Betaproteobacteria bacterium RIFCSPLOWO2_12_FULL_62_13b]
MKIQEHDCVVLTQDLPDAGLKAGDMGTVVHIHNDGAGYEVEFITLAGETLAVITLLPQQIRGIARGDIAHVREMHAS